jgi:hypothetical protein
MTFKINRDADMSQEKMEKITVQRAVDISGKIMYIPLKLLTFPLVSVAQKKNAASSSK